MNHKIVKALVILLLISVVSSNTHAGVVYENNQSFNDFMVIDQTECSGGSCLYDYKLHGLIPSDRFGWSMALGTRNGEIPAILVGAPMAEGRGTLFPMSGSVFLYQFLDSDEDGVIFEPAVVRAINNVDHWPNRIDHPVTVATGRQSYNRAVGDRMGWALAWINDLNGDTYLDFAATAPFADTGAPTQITSPPPVPQYINGGIVYLLSGQNGQIITNGMIFPPKDPYGVNRDEIEPENWFGLSVAYGADYYGTNNPDPYKRDPVLVIGAPGPGESGLHSASSSRNCGYVAILSLATGTPVLAEVVVPDNRQGGQQFGFSVALAWDGSEGHLAVGAPFFDSYGPNRGRIYIYDAGNPAPTAVYDGPSDEAHMGHACSYMCYLGPNCPDAVAVSAPGWYGDEGLVYIISDIGIDRIILGQNERDQFGLSLAGAGDQDLDGYDELLIGAPYFDAKNASNVLVENSDVGRAYLYYSTDNYTSPTVMNGEDLIDHFGWSVGSYDFTGDGINELFIGAAWADQYVPLESGGFRGFSGSVYVYNESDFYEP